MGLWIHFRCLRPLTPPSPYGRGGETAALTFAGLLIIFPRLIDGIAAALTGGGVPYKGAIGGAIVLVIVAIQWLSSQRGDAIALSGRG